MLEVTISLALPPSTNQLFANTSHGRCKTRAYRQWRKFAVADIALQAGKARFAGEFTVEVRASDRELKRNRDCDNLGKAIVDALAEAGTIAGDDQRWMRSISIGWDASLDPGVCSVTIRELVAGLKDKPATILPEKRKEASRAIVGARDALRKRGICVTVDRIHLQTGNRT